MIIAEIPEQFRFTKRWLSGRVFLSVSFAFLLVSTLFVVYYCPIDGCAFSAFTSQTARFKSWSQTVDEHLSTTKHIQTQLYSSRRFDASNKLSFEIIVSQNSTVFDMKGNDVIVFLHIQKTGGTSFGRHLVKDLDLVNPCECKKGRKRCKCLRPDSDAKFWLFSRYTTGWKCGLHADWTELTNCVDSVMDESEKSVEKRRYFYITLLREPVARFLSEFRHVQRGATWKSSRHWCGGRIATPEELPPCYEDNDWRDVSLDEFIGCTHNLAINRQTRMLADLTLVGCYNASSMSAQQRDSVLLESAKRNLKEMAFFGCSEYQKISQYLFESTFKLHFMHPFIQLNETHSSLMRDEIGDDLLAKIKQINYLDIQLYEFSKQLLFDRFNRMKALDANFTHNFNNLGNLGQNEERLLQANNTEIFPEFRILKKIEKQKRKKMKQKALFKSHSSLNDSAASI